MWIAMILVVRYPKEQGRAWNYQAPAKLAGYINDVLGCLEIIALGAKKNAEKKQKHTAAWCKLRI